jgi:hypothetical protein
MTAGVALLDMATERRRAASLDRRHHPALCRGQGSTVPLAQASPWRRNRSVTSGPNRPTGPTSQPEDGSVRLEPMGTGHGSRSNGLVVAQALLVAIRRYLAVVLRLLCPISN